MCRVDRAVGTYTQGQFQAGVDIDLILYIQAQLSDLHFSRIHGFFSGDPGECIRVTDRVGIRCHEFFQRSESVVALRCRHEHVTYILVFVVTTDSSGMLTPVDREVIGDVVDIVLNVVVVREVLLPGAHVVLAGASCVCSRGTALGWITHDIDEGEHAARGRTGGADLGSGSDELVGEFTPPVTVQFHSGCANLVVETVLRVGK